MKVIGLGAPGDLHVRLDACEVDVLDEGITMRDGIALGSTDERQAWAGRSYRFQVVAQSGDAS